MTLKIMILVLVGTLLIIKAEIPNPSYARTMLKVSRSLPGETEELEVRTAEGNIATLIVKRRGRVESLKRSQLNLDVFNVQNDTSKNSQDKKNSGNIISLATITSNTEKKNASIMENKQSPLLKLETNNPQNDGKRAESDNWTPLDTDGRLLNIIDVTNGTYSSWKALPSETTKNSQDRDERTFSNEESVKERLTLFPHQPKPLTRTNIGANSSKNRGSKDVPPEVTIGSEINVKAIQKRTPMSLDADGTPVIHGIRVPDEPIDKIQTWRNARVINNKLVSDTSTSSTSQPIAATTYQQFKRFFQDVNRRYGRDSDGEPHNVFFEWDPTNHRNTALNADVYETKNENYRSNIQKRMLHPEGTPSYSNSPIYTPESQKNASLSLKPGARAPVLQYAHPELGVQPARILKSGRKRTDNFQEHHNLYTEQRYKKKYVLNDKNVIDSYNIKNYYPNKHFYGLKHIVEPPLWVKISENLKNQFSTGVERVSQLTKPVFHPFVEATQKISQNLGFSHGQEAQEKIGIVAPASSILIPALGLVASGAALGIGAVAVGRYLDVDVLRRSNEERESIKELVKQRSLHGINDASGNFENSPVITDDSNDDRFVVLSNRGFSPIQTDQTKDSENWQAQLSVDKGKNVMQGDPKRRRRSLGDLDIFNAEKDMANLVRSKRIERTELNSMMDLVNDEVFENHHVPGDWTKTPCAKRIFCDAMIQRNLDSSIRMEEKMTSLPSQIQPGVTHKVSEYFQDVMEAIRTHDCSGFLCPHSRVSLEK